MKLTKNVEISAKKFDLEIRFTQHTQDNTRGFVNISLKNEDEVQFFSDMKLVAAKDGNLFIAEPQRKTEDKETKKTKYFKIYQISQAVKDLAVKLISEELAKTEKADETKL